MNCVINKQFFWCSFLPPPLWEPLKCVQCINNYYFYVLYSFEKILVSQYKKKIDLSQLTT